MASGLSRACRRARSCSASLPAGCRRRWQRWRGCSWRTSGTSVPPSPRFAIGRRPPAGDPVFRDFVASTPIDRRAPVQSRRRHPMAVLTQDDLLEAIDKMTVLELSEFIKRFEERYGVTAAAPAAAAAAPAAAEAAP